jgi:branched-subunit amino acid aminotransferase/4-amino-4-deoxychorismate lyase
MLIANNQLNAVNAAIRLTVTDGISDRGLLSSAYQDPTFIETASQIPFNLKTSMTATIVNTRRNENSLSSRIKSISYLDNILAKKEAVINGFDEAILLNSKSLVAEGAISNIFVVKNNMIYTPPIEDGALPGITRYVILNELKIKDIQIVEHHIDKEMLFNADELFISNALLGVKPIHKLDDKNFDETFDVTTLIANTLRYQCDYI